MIDLRGSSPDWCGQTSWLPFPASRFHCSSPGIFISLAVRHSQVIGPIPCLTFYASLCIRVESRLSPTLLIHSAVLLLQPHFSLHLCYLMVGPLPPNLLRACSCLSSSQNFPPALPPSKQTGCCLIPYFPCSFQAYCLCSRFFLIFLFLLVLVLIIQKEWLITVCCFIFCYCKDVMSHPSLCSDVHVSPRPAACVLSGFTPLCSLPQLSCILKESKFRFSVFFLSNDLAALLQTKTVWFSLYELNFCACLL